MSNPKTLALSALTATVSQEYTLGDIVTMFVSQWEVKINDKKISLQKQLKDVNSQVKATIAKIVGNVEGKLKDVLEGTITLPSFTVTPKIDHVTFDGKKVNYQVRVNIELLGKKTSEVMSGEWEMSDELKGLIGEHSTLVENQKVLMEEISKMDMELRNVASKERQVKGELTRRQLETSGVDLASLTIESLGLTLGNGE